jgi:hypothetical protein
VRHRLRGRAVRLCSLAAGAATAVVVAAIALPAAATSAAGSAGVASAAAPGEAAAVTLINGVRLAVKSSPAGVQQVAVRNAGGTDSLLSLRLGGASYEIPADALPYLGHGLDPSLFSLANLQREEKSGRLPVTISYSGTRPSLPGVSVTRWGGGSATGYLTAAGAKVFGAALARQFVSDHARASYGQDGLFAGGVRIALAGVPAVTTPVRPAYQMRTLTMVGRNLTGGKDYGDSIIVFNAANANIFGGPDFEGFGFFWKGTAKFSVPVGAYWAIGDFLTFGKHGSNPRERLVVLPQFNVKNATTVRVNERSASSQITAATPRPAVASQVSIDLIRSGLHGSVNSFTFIDSGISLFVSPTTAKPTVGGLRTYTTATLTNPPKTKGTPYFYNLDYQGPDGIIPSQHYVVTPDDLATINEVFYQDVKSLGDWFDFGGFAGQLAGGLIAEGVPFRLPAQQVQYFSAGAGIVWQFDYLQNLYSFGSSFINDAWRTLPAGGQLTEDWNAYPLHPQPDVQLLTGAFAAELPQYPSAFRAGKFLVLSETPFSDNYFGHLGVGFYGPFSETLVDSYAVYQNGKRVAHGNPATFGVLPVKLSSKPSVIRFVLNAGTWGPKYPLSPASSTVWTWKTQAEPDATVPHSWFCGYKIVKGNTVPEYRCAIQPLLTLNYQVQGMSLTGHTAPGPQTVDVSVSHLQLTAASAITGLSAAYSLNDGQSFEPAAVTAVGGGQFRVGFSAPAGTDVTLRVSATDAAGGSITETIVRAYGISS